MLPDWPAGTVTILATAGDTPHAIPVSAAVRAGPRRALIALAATRNSLARLQADPHVALTIVCEGTAVTAYGHARVLDDHDHHDHHENDRDHDHDDDDRDRDRDEDHHDHRLPAGVAAVEIVVDRVEDHDRPTFAIESGVRWRWTDADAERRDAGVRAALVGLAHLAERAQPD